MRCMNANKATIYYALYKGKEAILDENGNHTGQYEVKYRSPQSIKANVSAARGEISTRQFGESEEYDRVIVLDDTNTQIDEYSVLWIDSIPETDSSGNLAVDADGMITAPWDYVVKKVARSLNSVSIAVSKVDLNG